MTHAYLYVSYISSQLLSYLKSCWSCIIFTVHYTMYVVTHSRIAKNVPSQNPPSWMLTLIFSVTTGFLLADIHIIKARIVSNKVRSYTTFCVRRNTNAEGFCHTFQQNVDVTSLVNSLLLLLLISRPTWGINANVYKSIVS